MGRGPRVGADRKALGRKQMHALICEVTVTDGGRSLRYTGVHSRAQGHAGRCNQAWGAVPQCGCATAWGFAARRLVEALNGGYMVGTWVRTFLGRRVPHGQLLQRVGVQSYCFGAPPFPHRGCVVLISLALCSLPTHMVV